jgi:nucleotidyltransferase/DNA polymerase involved in DNA repair
MSNSSENFAHKISDPSDSTEFPRAILHIDGDSFFVGCELTRMPWLRGRPVVTGLEKGIASAMSREAKARGITRGMRIHDMRRLCPEIIILPSDFGLYDRYAHRMYSIVRRYAPFIEEYSIDECFADLGSSPFCATMSYEAIARAIQDDLHASLGMTFSAGVGVNKVTAKIASKLNKPAGFTLLPVSMIESVLSATPIGSVWGIGSSTTVDLGKLGIRTALDLARKDRAWVAEHCHRPIAEIHAELNGSFIKELTPVSMHEPRSIQHTRTFKPVSKDPVFLLSQLSYHVEQASARARAQKLLATTVYFFLKTTDFHYIRAEIILPRATAVPSEILSVIEVQFKKIFMPNLMYRATGVTLSGLRKSGTETVSLFARHTDRSCGAGEIIHATADRINHRFGEESIFLGSSLKALKSNTKERNTIRKESPYSIDLKECGDFEIIYLGEVK